VLFETAGGIPMSRYPRANAGMIPPTGRMTYRVGEVESLLGIGRSKIYRLLGEGKLEGVKLGGVMLIKASSIAKMLENAA
jgi:excisionase family DNA binding protein